MRTFVIVIAFISLFGCANVGSSFSVAEIKIPPDDSAIVFFYRPSRLRAGHMSMPVFANEVKIGTLDNGAYFKRVMAPGVYKVHSDTHGIDRIATFSFEPGKRYFVKCFLDMGMWVGSIRFVDVHEDKAIPEIKETAVQL